MTSDGLRVRPACPRCRLIASVIRYDGLVDGALEWQLNLRSREALTAVIGMDAVEKLWALAAAR